MKLLLRQTLSSGAAFLARGEDQRFHILWQGESLLNAGSISEALALVDGTTFRGKGPGKSDVELSPFAARWMIATHADYAAAGLVRETGAQRPALLEVPVQAEPNSLPIPLARSAASEPRRGRVVPMRERARANGVAPLTGQPAPPAPSVAPGLTLRIDPAIG